MAEGRPLARQTSKLVHALKQPVRSFLARHGLEISSLQHGSGKNVAGYLAFARPDLLVDVGANQGQYVMRMRALGYQGRTISFEPGTEAHRLLTRNAAADQAWAVRKLAISDEAGCVGLRVSRNLVSSSTLRVGAEHVTADPYSATAHTETVDCARLDTVLRDEPGHRIWLKLDVQGSEDKVLAGATDTLSRVQVVQCELSVAPLYDGQAGYLDIFRLLDARGFALIDIEPGFRQPSSGRLLQFDGIFMRRASHG